MLLHSSIPRLSGYRQGDGRIGIILVYAPYMSSALSVTCEIEAMSLWAGLGVGLATRIQPAGNIVRELAEEAEDVLKRCAGLKPAEAHARCISTYRVMKAQTNRPRAQEFATLISATSAGDVALLPLKGWSDHAVDAGVDVIVARGREAAGHVKGEFSTLALVTRVVDSVALARAIEHQCIDCLTNRISVT